MTILEWASHQPVGMIGQVRMVVRLAIFVATCICSATLSAQSTQDSSFSYQGQLAASNQVLTGNGDFRFALFDAATGGNQIAPVQVADNVAIAAGNFAVTLNFGQSPWAGQRRWIEISVRFPAGAGAFTTLSPRQAISTTPYAALALNAASLNGQPSSFFQNAANLTSGTLPVSRLSSTVARTDVAQTFSGAVTMSNNANVFAGNGSGLLSLSASNLASGVVSDGLLSSNIPRLNSTNIWGGASNTFSNELYSSVAVISSRLLVRGAEAGLELSRMPLAPNYWKLSLQANAGAAGDDLQFLRYNNSSFGGLSMVIKNDTGRVGMGTSFPNTKLAVAGYDASGPAADVAISLTNQAPLGGYWSMNSLANPNPGIVEPGSMAIYNANGLYAILTQTGKLGLYGVFAPQAALDVNGQVYTRSGGIKFPDNTVQTRASNVGFGVAEFTEPGTWSFTVPASVFVISVEMWGGGGGGGFGTATDGGGGGGSGAYVRGKMAVTPGQVFTVIVGAGGTGADSSTPASWGGNSAINLGAAAQFFAGGGAPAVREQGGEGAGVPPGTNAILRSGYMGSFGGQDDLGMRKGGPGAPSPYAGRSSDGGAGNGGTGQGHDDISGYSGWDGAVLIDW